MNDDPRPPIPSPPSSPRRDAAPPTGRAAELARLLKLQPHPEGGHYRELFRSPHAVSPADGRPRRSALTSIDFLLIRSEFSAWHRVASDEVWHLLEGDGVRLWLMPPSLATLDRLDLRAADAGAAPRHVVPAGYWQAAEPLGDFAYCGATVAPGFEFDDFSFLRDQPGGARVLDRLDGALRRLL